MKNVILPVTLALVAFVALAAPPGARSPASDRAAIEQLEHQWLNAESDRATLERILADDFAHPVAAGIVLTKAQHIDWATRHPRPATRQARFERLDVRLFPDTAIATGIVNETGPSGANSRRAIFGRFLLSRGALAGGQRPGKRAQPLSVSAGGRGGL